METGSTVMGRISPGWVNLCALAKLVTRAGGEVIAGNEY
jgi:hypothetical protein